MLDVVKLCLLKKILKHSGKIPWLVEFNEKGLIFFDISLKRMRETSPSASIITLIEKFISISCQLTLMSDKKMFTYAFACKAWIFNCVNSFDFWKSLNSRLRRWLQLCPSYSCKNFYKNWDLYFHETNDNQIWHTGTFREVDLNETDQAGVRGVITLRPYGFKRYSNFLSGRAMIIKFGQIISKRRQLS